jgi:hypothetical protein
MNSALGKNVLFRDDPFRDIVDSESPYASIRGMVLDESGKPAPGMVITIESRLSMETFKVTTDRNGRYNYDGLPAGEYLVCVASMGENGLPRTVPLRLGRITISDFDLKFFDAGTYGNSTPPLDGQLGNALDASSWSNELRRNYVKARQAATGRA